MVTKYKALIESHNEKVHKSLEELRLAANNCSKETPRAVANALGTLREVVDDNVLYVEEENSYKKVISGMIKQFENKCGCNLPEAWVKSLEKDRKKKEGHNVIRTDGKKGTIII